MSNPKRHGSYARGEESKRRRIPARRVIPAALLALVAIGMTGAGWAYGTSGEKYAAPGTVTTTQTVQGKVVTVKGVKKIRLPARTVHRNGKTIRLPGRTVAYTDIVAGPTKTVNGTVFKTITKQGSVVTTVVTLPAGTVTQTVPVTVTDTVPVTVTETVTETVPT